MSASEKVMNDIYVRKYIFSYLRTKPKIACFTCGLCCVWENKTVNDYVIHPDYYSDTRYNYDCWNCYYNYPRKIIYSSNTRG
tara:strand:- start:325 stop:570 length:246 start_codon:yes stop_codon:yes gene_type:complete